MRRHKPLPGELFARKNGVWFSRNCAVVPTGARWWYRIYINGVRHSFSLQTSDKVEAEARVEAWFRGLRLGTHEQFLQYIIERGRKAERELAGILAKKGVVTRSGK